MSITVLGYHDQALVDQVNAQAAERAAAARAAEVSTTDDFSTVLSEASQSTTQNTSNSVNCPVDLYSIFEEASSTYGVSVNLLTSIARVESNFRSDAVSSAGAVGIMQLMPATAASLGVTNSYDARENIMGGAKLISQLLSKYNGNTSLALAAYNAGSGNVDKYGGIPPFTETQNYVKKVLSYFNSENRSELKDTLSNVLSSGSVGSDALDALVDLLNTIKSNDASTTSSSDTASAETSSSTETSSASATNQSITVTVINGTVNTQASEVTAASVSTEESESANTSVLSEENTVIGEAISTERTANS